MDAGRKRLLRWTGWVLLSCLVLAAGWLIAQRGQSWIQQIRAREWILSWQQLAGAALSLMASIWFIPEGWVMVCRSLGSRERRKRLRGIWFASQLGRYIPGKIWLFAGRASYLRSRGMSTARASLAPLADLFFMAAAAGLTSLVGLLAWGGEMSPELFTILILASSLALLLPLLRPAQKLLLKTVGRETGTTGPMDMDHREALRLIGLYSGLWALRSLSVYLFLSGFGMEDIGFLPCMAGVPLSWLAGYLAFFVPGGIGVREAALVGILSDGANAGPLLLLVAGHRLLLSLCELALGLLSFGAFGKKRKETGENPE